MSAQEIELANIYRFFGLDDFEPDQDRWQAAFDNVEKVYGFKFNGNHTEKIERDPPEHLKKAYPDLSYEQWCEFLTHIKALAEVYRLTFDANTLPNYNEDLKNTPDSLQKPLEDINYKGALGRNFAPDAGDEYMEEYYHHVTGAKDYRIKDGLSPEKLSDLLNKFMVPTA